MSLLGSSCPEEELCHQMTALTDEMNVNYLYYFSTSSIHKCYEPLYTLCKINMYRVYRLPVLFTFTFKLYRNVIFEATCILYSYISYVINTRVNLNHLCLRSNVNFLEPLVFPIVTLALACVAGARKGKGEGKSGARGPGKGKEAPAASPLFISSFSFAGERKIAIGSFLIMRQSLPDTTF